MPSGIADGAGVFGAVLAALCCAGTPIVVSVITAVGLGFLRNDAILWPVMLASLAVALWGFWQGVRVHRNTAPALLGTVGAISLASGVIFVHGPVARPMIYVGALLLLGATLWNARLRRARARCVRTESAAATGVA
ncbi:MAG: MerC domain-containing protein [Gemmatimonadaceae bacterium]|nr:MerC domain-containing protein [Gemmatimonadaceae bacterium]